MKINFITEAIEPMYNWLLNAKKTGIKDEEQLRKILRMPEYKIEFERYGMKQLPVCGIDFEEAVDFFLHFETKKFTNKRLDYKQKDFLKFYENIEQKVNQIKMFESFDENNLAQLNELLSNSLPNEILNQSEDYNILLVISIGNSMGWPYKNYIDFDVANFQYINDKNTFVHILSHEIYHTFFGSLINENMLPQEFFMVNFAFEGLAVHFNNNAITVNKPGKYGNEMIGLDLPTWKFYEDQFDELFYEIKKDYEISSNLTMEEVNNLLSSKYETFEFTSLKTGQKMKILHYPTYYMGAYFWGIIDYAFGKEVLYSTLKNPAKFKDTYNNALDSLHISKYHL